MKPFMESKHLKVLKNLLKLRVQEKRRFLSLIILQYLALFFSMIFALAPIFIAPEVGLGAAVVCVVLAFLLWSLSLWASETRSALVKILSPVFYMNGDEISYQDAQEFLYSLRKDLLLADKQEKAHADSK